MPGRRPSAGVSLFLPSITIKQTDSPGAHSHPAPVLVDQLEGPDSEIVAKLNTSYRKVLVVGKDVFVPPIYSTRARPYQFHIREIRFLYYLAQENNDFDKACALADVSPRFAKKFLKSNEYRQFALEAVEDQAIQEGRTPKRVVLEIDRMYKGERVVTDSQMDALKMMRDIVIPKTKDTGTVGPGGVTVNLNFPALPADVQSKLKDIADQAASGEHAA